MTDQLDRLNAALAGRTPSSERSDGDGLHGGGPEASPPGGDQAPSPRTAEKDEFGVIGEVGPAGTPRHLSMPERRVRAAAMLLAVYGAVLPVWIVADTRILVNALIVGSLYTLPAFIGCGALIRRCKWARTAGVVVGAVWLLLAIASIAVSLWWFAGHEGMSLDYWGVIVEPVLLLVLPSAAVVVILAPASVRTVSSPGRPARP